MSAQEALDLLTAAYQNEVQRRSRRFILDDNTATNLALLAEYLTQPIPRFGVMCCGTCGNGKTTLLYAFQQIVNYLHKSNHFSFLDSGNTQFKAEIQICTAKEIIRIAKDAKAFKAIQEMAMLAIDDLGAEPAEILVFGNALSPVIDLIEYRYNHQLFTFTTTNLTGSQIREKYGARMADRLNEMLHTIVFADKSYRVMNPI